MLVQFAKADMLRLSGRSIRCRPRPVIGLHQIGRVIKRNGFDKNNHLAIFMRHPDTFAQHGGRICGI